MADLKPKNITLQAYNIENDDLKAVVPDLFVTLKQKWENEGIAANRRLLLNSTTSEEDVLADLQVNQKYIIGTMMRIAPTKEVPKNLMNYLMIKLYKFQQQLLIMIILQ